MLESCFSGVAPAVDQIKHGRTGRLEASMTARHRYKLHLHPAEAAPDLQSKAVISGEGTAVGRRGSDIAQKVGGALWRGTRVLETAYKPRPTRVAVITLIFTAVMCCACL